MVYYPRRRRYPRRKNRTYKKRAVKRTVGVKRLAKKVENIKKQIKRDIEVKEYTPSPVPDALIVAQVDVNATGMYIGDLDVANVGQGTGGNNRIGNKTKLIGIGMRFAVTQQLSTTLGGRLIFEIFRTKDMNNSVANIRDLIYDVDSISTVIDYNSSKNQDFIKSKTNPTGIFELVGSKTIYMRSDEISSTMNVFKNFKMFIKQRQQLSYSGSPQQKPSNVRYIMCIRAEQGNHDSAAASTLLVPAQGTNTGYNVRYQLTSYYTDM